MSSGHWAMSQHWPIKFVRLQGEVEKYEKWFFGLIVAVGQVDIALANDINSMLARNKDIKNPEKWHAGGDVGLSMDLYKKYTGARIPVGWGSKRNVKEKIDDLGGHAVAAGLLQTYLDVVNTPTIKGLAEIP
eukprot:6782635-Karenia_brevis.AAC.1